MSKVDGGDMSEVDGLEDCPWGDSSHVLEFDWSSGDVQVVCQDCGARGPMADSMDKAEYEWNHVASRKPYPEEAT